MAASQAIQPPLAAAAEPALTPTPLAATASSVIVVTVRGNNRQPRARVGSGSQCRGVVPAALRRGRAGGAIDLVIAQHDRTPSVSTSYSTLHSIRTLSARTQPEPSGFIRRIVARLRVPCANAVPQNDAWVRRSLD